MVVSFARIGAALAMKVEDVFVQDHRLRVRLREKAASAARCRATTPSVYGRPARSDNETPCSPPASS
jgi:hypothetical protein